MRVGLYIRVSTIEQRDEGYSLDNQKERLLAFAKSQGWDDVQIYMDDGFTGTDMERPGLKRMVRHIEEKILQAVVVLKLDRLSRKQKDTLYLLEDVFDKNSVIFKSATEPFDTSTSLGKAMIGILAIFAQLERDMIVERTTSGRRTRVSQGKWYGGPAPFGYQWNKELQELEIVPEEADIVKEIYTRYQQGQSLSSIGEWALTMSRSRKFGHSNIRDTLNRPIYMGKLANAGALADGNHESIIDVEDWHEVQIEMSRRQEGLPPIGEYLLTGLLKCGVCGSPIVHVKRTTNKNGRNYSYELYACKQQHVRKKDRTNHCTLGYFRRSDIEDFIIDKIKSAGTEQSKLIKTIDSKKSVDNSHLIHAIETKLDVIKSSMENLYDGIQSGAIKAAAVSDRIKKLEEEQESLSTQLDGIKDKRPNLHSANHVAKLIKQVGDLWDKLTEDEQKKIIRKVVITIVLNKETEHDIVWNTLK